MNSRTDISDIFHKYTDNVYFQPPTNTRIKYPCWVYKRVGYDTRNADNRKYMVRPHYQATWITKDPDSDVPVRVLDDFEYIRHQTRMTNDSLYHDVFDIYY